MQVIFDSAEHLARVREFAEGVLAVLAEDGLSDSPLAEDHRGVLQALAEAVPENVSFPASPELTLSGEEEAVLGRLMEDAANLRVEENAFGRRTLASFVVDCVFPDGAEVASELQIEPDVIVMPGGTSRPGVVYNPQYYTVGQFAAAPADVGETIAYLINEAGVTEDTAGSEAGEVSWKVRDPAVLVRYLVIPPAPPPAPAP